MARKSKRTSKKLKPNVRRPKLSLCMIVRDNRQTIEACLTSIRPYVDEMVVVDTGSVDETPRIARRLGATLSTFPWCDDFSAARNVSLERAHGQWLFWMDSDDTIPPDCGRRLRELADSAHPEDILGYVMQVHCPGPPSRWEQDLTVVDHVKLFRNRPELRFEGRIHEQIIPAIRRAGGQVGWTDIHVVHSGSDHSPQARKRKYERDLALLKLELAECPNHPFHLFNMGMTYNDMEEHQEAVDWLRRALAAADMGESHVRKIYALLAGSLAALGKTSEALEVIQRGRSYFPDDVELLFRLGILLHNQGKLAEAVAVYRKALSRREVKYFASMDPAIGGHKSRHNLALVYADQGRHELAEVQWRTILESRPTYRRGWYYLGLCLAKQGKLASLGILAGHMRSRPELESELLLLEAEQLLASGNAAPLRAHLSVLQRKQPDDERVGAFACRYFYEHGSLAEAQAVLEDYLVRHGEDPATLHNLGVVYYRQQLLPQAVNALRRSLELRLDAQHTRAQLALVERAMESIPPAAEGTQA